MKQAIIMRAGALAVVACLSCAPPGRMPLLVPESGESITGIELSITTASLSVGAESPTVLLALLSSGEKRRIDPLEAEWRSSDDQVAMVDDQGRISARSPGSADIEARWQERSARLSVTVARAANLDALRISEVFYDAPGADDGKEFIEIVNRGDEPVPLEGLMLRDGAHGNDAYRFEAGMVLAPHACLVVAASRSAFTAYFGREADAEGLPFVLNNDGEAVLLVKEGAPAPIDVLYIRGGTSDVPPPPEWGAGRVPAAGVGQSLKRDPGPDTDSAADWSAGVPEPGAP